MKAVPFEYSTPELNIGQPETRRRRMNNHEKISNLGEQLPNFKYLTNNKESYFSPKTNLMIKGLHAMFYSSDAAGLREFLRDKLGLKANDIGRGWLIFDIPEADLGCHPADEANGAPSGTHDISFYCDDIEQTFIELRGKGVEFVGDIEDHGYGLVSHIKAPGNFTIQLYQPKYQK